MRISPSLPPRINDLGRDEPPPDSIQPQRSEREHSGADQSPEQPDSLDPFPVTAEDAKVKALISQAAQPRSKRSVAQLDLDGAPRPLLLRATEALLTLVEGEGQDQTVAKPDRIRVLEARMTPDDLIRLRQTIRTATQALLAVAVEENKSKGPIIAEAIVERLFNPTSERARSLTVEISQIVNREMGRMLEQAGLLYIVSRHAKPSSTEVSVDVSAALRAFAAELKSEALRRAMFNRHFQSEQAQQGAIYFDGNALVNVLGKRVEDLAGESSLMRLPGYADLSAIERLAVVRKWLDERGLDSQYAFGTVENAMASVLKASALARGKSAAGSYATVADLHRAFIALVHDWEHAEGCLVDPRVLFGLNLAKAARIVLAGDTPQERLADLRSFVNDVLTEYSGPPRFDKRAAALESLMVASGLTEAELTRPLRATGKSALATFLDESRGPRRLDGFIATDKGVRIPMSAVAARVEMVESTFRTRDRPNAPFFKAWARIRLRIERVPLTDAAVEAKATELVRLYEKRESEAKTGNTETNDAKRKPSNVMALCNPIGVMLNPLNALGCLDSLGGALDPQTARDLRHWLDNTPIVSNVIGFAEGVSTGNVEEIINSVPVISNLYNLEEGLRTSDYKRAGMAAITLVPFAGSVAVIVDGVVNDDAAEVVGGIEGLGLDFLTLGEGHLLSKGGGFRSVVTHSAVDEGRVRPARAIPHDAIPPALQLHADHTLTVLKDLGYADDAKALQVRYPRANEVGKPAPAPRTPVSTVPSLDAARLVKQLEGFEVRPRPVSLRQNASGMLWDSDSVAHYAEFKGKLYRVAPDSARTAPRRPIWNVVSPDGSNRVATLPLEYVINRETREARWRIAKDYPTLRGGGLFKGDEVPVLSKEEWNRTRNDGVDGKLIQKVDEAFEYDEDVRVFDSQSDEKVYLVYDKYEREYYRIDNGGTFSPDPVRVYDYRQIRTWRVTNQAEIIPPGVKQVPIENIVPSRSRESLSQSRFEAVLTRIKDGQKLDAVKATFDPKDGKYHLNDGNHRYYAAQDLSLTQIPVNVAE